MGGVHTDNVLGRGGSCIYKEGGRAGSAVRLMPDGSLCCGKKGEHQGVADVFLGFDHVDMRVMDVRKVEPFYDRLFLELGLAKKSYVRVEGDEWTVSEARTDDYNALEYHAEGPKPEYFIGLIEDPSHRPGFTRVALRIADVGEVNRWIERLPGMGARNVEASDDMNAYPAVFFEDSLGTKLERCARS
ncbi:MAG: hypothetical protein NVS1B14_08040 [Vulcanimicrobiaceae bacterium]